MQIGFCFDQSRCSGCYTCVVACKDWHDIPPGPVSWMRIMETESGTFPDVSVSFLAIPCFHCGSPACAAVCPAGAISKLSDSGIVVVDREKCLGFSRCGGFCRQACPFGTPQFGDGPDAKMEKCDLCLERWKQGKKPICVEACPMRALDAGPINALEEMYRDRRTTKTVEGFSYDDRLQPSFICRRKDRRTK